MISLRRLSAIALAMAASIGTTTLSGHAQDSVVIGAALAESGWMVAYDGPPSKGIEMAVEDLNKDGGVLGKQVEVIFKDSRTDLARGAQVAQELLAEGAQMLIVSCDFDMGAPAALAAESAGKISMGLA